MFEKKQELLQSVISTFGTKKSASESRVIGAAERLYVPKSSEAVKQRGGTTGRVIEVVKAALADGKPIPTRDLLPLLKENNIEVTGKDPVISVSAILSREKDVFFSDRKLGWSLK